MFNTLPAVSLAVTVGSISSSSPCVRLSKSRQPLSAELGLRFLIVSGIQYSGIRITLHGAIQCFQEPITWSEQLPCVRVTAFAWTSVFLERFWRTFLIRQTSQPKPTDLKMIFFAFYKRLVFLFDILYFEYARSGLRAPGALYNVLKYIFLQNYQ